MTIHRSEASKEQRKKARMTKYYANKKNKICQECAEPVETGATYCTACNKRVRDARNARYGVLRQEARQQGVCFRCKQEAVPDRLYCTICILKQAAYDNLGSSARFPELLEKLEEQEYRCPYTNRILIVGGNATVEHILPKSRFPEYVHDINNIEWLDREANIMKGALTRVEFVSTLKLIHENLASRGDT